MRLVQSSKFHLPSQLSASHVSAALRLSLASVVLTSVMSGCSTGKATICDLQYCDDKSGLESYRNYETRIEYPCIDTVTPAAVANSQEPRNIISRASDETREMTLEEAVSVALSHNDVIETSALGGVGTKVILNNPAAAVSVYDPAIQRSGVLFGRGRGVEAALADFDTTFSTSMVWGRSEAATSNLLPSSKETGTFRSSLSKQFAYGGSFQLNNDWNYLGTQNAPATGFQSAYYGRVGGQYRHPLLAGGGAEFTRIAGPVNPNFGAITGVGQGVLIARISSDISIADFQIAVRNAVQDIENAYWDLYLTYRIYDTAVVAHQSAFQTWREAQDRLEVGILKPADELQARERLYETKANVENTLSDLFAAEVELRRLIGLPMNDGTVLRPIDEPVLAEVVPDWRTCITDGLTHRVELRRQKWSIKSTQLQLKAAKSLVRPRLDFVGSYDFNGYGDRLASQSNAAYGSAFGTLTRQDDQSWSAGMELSMPVGFRQARSQVRNIELQLTKAMAVLASQEKNVAHDIAISVQDVTASFAAAQSNYKRLSAAAKRVELLEAERDVGTLTLDLVLRAQAAHAQAESAYYQQLVRYAKAITNLQYSTGKLLPHHGVVLAEGGWCGPAYQDAAVRAHVRTHGKDAPRMETAPCEFVSPGPAGRVELNSVITEESVIQPEVIAPPVSDENADEGMGETKSKDLDDDPRQMKLLPQGKKAAINEQPGGGREERFKGSSKAGQRTTSESAVPEPNVGDQARSMLIPPPGTSAKDDRRTLLDRLVPERLRLAQPIRGRTATVERDEQRQ